MATAKPKVKLTGKDGNAFSIMGACHEAWRKAKRDPAEWKTIQADMMSGDYNHLLCVAIDHFNVS